MADETILKMQVRGRVISSTPKFILKNFGKEGYQKWAEAISLNAYKVYNDPIDEEKWFSLRESLIKPFSNIAQLFYDWDVKKACWEMGRFNADYGFTNVSKLRIKVGSTHSIFEKSDELINSNYKPCSTSLISTSDFSRLFRIKDFPEMDKTIEFHTAGWMERILEINGCKKIQVDISKSLTQAHPYSELKISWE